MVILSHIVIKIVKKISDGKSISLKTFQKKSLVRKQTQKFAVDGNSHLNVNKIINHGRERPEDK